MKHNRVVILVTDNWKEGRQGFHTLMSHYENKIASYYEPEQSVEGVADLIDWTQKTVNLDIGGSTLLIWSTSDHVAQAVRFGVMDRIIDPESISLVHVVVGWDMDTWNVMKLDKQANVLGARDDYRAIHMKMVDKDIGL